MPYTITLSLVELRFLFLFAVAISEILSRSRGLYKSSPLSIRIVLRGL
jgi:hypothetical protein